MNDDLLPEEIMAMYNKNMCLSCEHYVFETRFCKQMNERLINQMQFCSSFSNPNQKIKTDPNKLKEFKQTFGGLA